MIPNGIYAGYMTGTGGSGMALFVLLDGVLSGADYGGVQFDGKYSTQVDGASTGVVAVKVPAGATVIQGVTAPPGGMNYEVPVSLPQGFEHTPFIHINTPLGNVNVRLQKIRDLP